MQIPHYRDELEFLERVFLLVKIYTKIFFIETDSITIKMLRYYLFL